MNIWNHFQVEKVNSKVIAVLNQKGGVGKTTLAFNLAYALKEKKKRVLCIDMDPQANLSLLFGVTDSVYHVHNLLLNSVRELKPLHTPVTFGDIVQTAKGVSILPAGQELSGLELTVAGIAAPRQLLLRKMIHHNKITENFDYIVIDGPPTLGLLMVNIICASDGIFVPFQADQFSLKGLSQFHETLLNVEDMGISKPPVLLGHIPNLYEQRRKQEEKDFEIICQSLSDIQGTSETYLSPLANRVQLMKSNAQKKSIYDYQSKEYKELQQYFNRLAAIIEENLQ